MAEVQGMESDRYADIIYRKHPISVRHPQMSVAERAAQFSPFAALTGYGEAIGEAGRLTDERKELDEDVREGLDEKLQSLLARIGERPEVSVTYFQPDGRKDGGAYVTWRGRVKKVDVYGRYVVMSDGMRIPMGDIVELE